MLKICWDSREILSCVFLVQNKTEVEKSLKEDGQRCIYYLNCGDDNVNVYTRPTHQIVDINPVHIFV